MNFVPDAAAARIFEDVLANFAFLFGESRPAAELPRLEGRMRHVDSTRARVSFGCATAVSFASGLARMGGSGRRVLGFTNLGRLFARSSKSDLEHPLQTGPAFFKEPEQLRERLSHG